MVDCNFGVIIHGIWEVYSDLDSGVCNTSFKIIIVSYINDFKLLVFVLWSPIDNVCIPICVKDKFHWFLLVVSFND